MKKKIAIIANVLTPYRIPLYNYLSQFGDFELKIFVLAENEEHREWIIDRTQIKFSYRILPGLHGFVSKHESPVHINVGLFPLLMKYNPDVIITTGYADISIWEALLFCKIFRKKFILWNGSTLLSSEQTGGVFGWIKRIIVKNSDAYITYGTKSKEYLEYFGAKSQNIHVGVNTVDTKYFNSGVSKYRDGNNFCEIRSKYPKTLFLYVGRLTKGKGIKQMLKAMNVLRDPDIGLLVVGGGKEEGSLREYCINNNLQNVYFEGFCQQEDLMKYYALADIFIFPTFKEIWGLVINEALVSGLYVFCSKYAGVGYDIVEHKWNGELFDPYDIEELAGLICSAVEKKDIIRQRRGAIMEKACHDLDVARYAEAFFEAIGSE